MGFPDMAVSICLTCSSSMFYNQTAGPLRPAKPFPHKTSQHVRSLELGKTLMNLQRGRCPLSLLYTPSRSPGTISAPPADNIPADCSSCSQCVYIFISSILFIFTIILFIFNNIITCCIIIFPLSRFLNYIN